MCAVSDPLREHQRWRALAMNSGPLSQQMWAGAPRRARISSRTAIVPLAVIERATLPARDSRVNSSVTFRILILLPLVDVVESEVHRPDLVGTDRSDVSRS